MTSYVIKFDKTLGDEARGIIENLFHEKEWLWAKKPSDDVIMYIVETLDDIGEIPNAEIIQKTTKKLLSSVASSSHFNIEPMREILEDYIDDAVEEFTEDYSDKTLGKVVLFVLGVVVLAIVGIAVI